MILVPGGVIGALLKSYSPKMCVAAESLGLILDVLKIFNVMTTCGNNLSHKCIGKDLAVEQSLHYTVYLIRFNILILRSKI
jgi:hypothetical protein